MTTKIVGIITADEQDNRQVVYTKAEDTIKIEESIEGVSQVVTVEKEHLQTVAKLMR
ncbi:hypothetical protein [Lysinibacillus sp. NPDC047702]|uniref:hypothetical protein n=1 Tax=unclassified Lysinibacillus TaxID=2636778 RepID=UPI003D0417D1